MFGLRSTALAGAALLGVVASEAALAQQSAQVPASAGLESEIPRLLTAAGIVVQHETVSTRESSGGKFVSVKLSFRARRKDEEVGTNGDERTRKKKRKTKIE